MTETIQTPLTKMLGIRVPILLAGMSGVSHAELAAAVSNAGGLGVIGGLTLSPKVLRKEIAELKALLTDKSLPFGVDLAIPQVGGSARKTNHDYTHGHLPELIDIIIEEKAALFVVAVGVPPPYAVEKLHAAGIPIMNMVGAPKHVDKAIAAGVDLICAQGTAAGGHCGDIDAMALIPQCVDRCRGHKAPLGGGPIMVVGAGGIVDGQTLAAALALGAEAAWVGTRFVASEESSASNRHKESIVRSDALDTARTLVYSGRPLRALETDYLKEWHSKRKGLIEELCDKGTIPFYYDIEKASEEGRDFSLAENFPQLFGQGCGLIKDIKPAAAIMEEMMVEAIATMRSGASRISKI